MIGRVLGHYRVLEQVGAGGMGVVYRARDLRLERDVALKVLPEGTLADDSARHGFRKEALLLSRLNDPHIEAVYDFDSQDGVDFLVMEFVPGTTLDEKLHTGALPEKEVVRLGIQLVQGMVAAHAKGVVHRDLKPGNLRVTPEGNLKILDFGLARLLEPESAAGSSATLTASTDGQAAGTIPYMSPEQLRGEPVDARSDVYAAGAVLYELATGRRPFTEDQSAQLITAILTQPPIALGSIRRGISPGLEGIVLKALEKEPDLRYQSAKELGVDLQRLGAPAPLPHPQGERRRIHPRRPALLGGLAGLVALAVALYMIFDPNRGEALDSIAVLPFQNVTGEGDSEYLSDGITESIIGSLSRLPNLKKVIAFSSVVGLKGQAFDANAIGRKLDVRTVLMGRMRQRGDDLLVTAELVDSRDSKHLWGKQYDRKMADLLVVEADITNQILEGLRLRLSGAERLEISRPSTQDTEAYQLYNKGRYFAANIYVKDDALRAIDLFEQAIARDPKFALAYTGLADAYYNLSNAWMTPTEAMSKARQAALKALELDPMLAEAHASLGGIKSHYDWDWPAGEREIRRAIELNPGYSLAHQSYGVQLIMTGRFDAAETELARAQELDPLSMTTRFFAAQAEFLMCRYDEAIEQLRGMIDLDPKSYPAYSLLGEAQEQKGNLAEALATLEKARDLGGNPWVLAAIARVHAEAGRRDTARKMLDELGELSNREYVTPYAVATVYGALGEMDRAFEYLQRACDERCEDMIMIRADPRMSRLRRESRFAEFLRCAGFATE